MDNTQTKLERAADGLLIMSEADYPFDFVTANASVINDDLLLKLADKPLGTLIEKTTLDYLLRNMTDASRGSVTGDVADQFKNLSKVLKQELKDIIVYRVDKVRIDVFILGTDSGGNICGLRTKLIET